MKPAVVKITSRPLAQAASALATYRLRSLLSRFLWPRGDFEVLSIDSTLRQAIASGATIEVIEGSARQAGMTSLFEHGCMAVEEGLTTIEEVVRVMGMPDGC